MGHFRISAEQEVPPSKDGPVVDELSQLETRVDAMIEKLDSLFTMEDAPMLTSRRMVRNLHEVAALLEQFQKLQVEFAVLTSSGKYPDDRVKQVRVKIGEIMTMQNEAQTDMLLRMEQEFQDSNDVLDEELLQEADKLLEMSTTFGTGGWFDERVVGMVRELVHLSRRLNDPNIDLTDEEELEGERFFTRLSVTFLFGGLTPPLSVVLLSILQHTAQVSAQDSDLALLYPIAYSFPWLWFLLTFFLVSPMTAIGALAVFWPQIRPKIAAERLKIDDKGAEAPTGLGQADSKVE